MRSDEPSCAKCRHLTTDQGVAACRLYHDQLEVCEDFKDVSHHKPPLTGGLTGMLVWPRR